MFFDNLRVQAANLILAYLSQHVPGLPRSCLAGRIIMNIGAFYVGPQLVGVISDMLSRSTGQDSLRWSLAAICSCYVLALLFAARMRRTFQKDSDGASLLP